MCVGSLYYILNSIKGSKGILHLVVINNITYYFYKQHCILFVINNIEYYHQKGGKPVLCTRDNGAGCVCVMVLVFSLQIVWFKKQVSTQ